MINIVLSVQSKLDEANKPAAEEICKLSDAIFGTSVWISCFAASEFTFVKQIDQNKHQCWENAQYSRGNV